MSVTVSSAHNTKNHCHPSQKVIDRHVSKMNGKSYQTMGGIVSMAITFRIHLLRSLKASAVDTTAQYKQLTGRVETGDSRKLRHHIPV